MIDEEITLMNRFNNFNRDNPEVYELFKRFTFQAINKGHTRLSAWMIANRIRWETQIETVNDDYKISNDYIALYSRKFMKDYPQHDGFFRIKPMKRL
jgi:hypothetical protein